ncbi:radical SAM family heme chaperone HemW [Propioniciclava sp.]|uniref:radical SAM family heme chaperone HemW n=1 Tax=Propioniciclava sp. TaxID=2038686 RepID=UPI00260B14B5|nr:radical SAM family heme chaperone HemW [Propioniciclava sp.]
MTALPEAALPEAALGEVARTPLSVYVHVPFCATRCGYCDFNTYTSAELGAAPGASRAAYLDAVVREVELAASVLGEVPPVSTVFFGGGTPTLLAASELVGLLDAVRARLPLAPDAEVSTESNPESVDEAYLAEIRAGGFNRISFGMQSAVPAVLARLDRRHTPGRVPAVVGWARAAGFDSVSADLIYGTPGETPADWEASVRAALAAGPDHVSAYALALEPATRMAAQIRRGTLPEIDLDAQADCYELADALLGEAGMTAYEISNWALPGYECRHNLGYWRGDTWWGFGPGAHSHAGGVRWWNVKHPATYAGRLAAGESPAAEREVLTAEERREERVLLEIRISDGLPVAVLTASERRRVPTLVRRGLVVAEGDRLRLTLRGRLLADAVVRDLLD